MVVDDYCPKNKKEWRRWLIHHHKKKESVWLILYKKQSPQHNITWSDAVEEALCFGWIDSTKRSIDCEKYKQYFSKRKTKSNWSKINKQKINVLIDQGLMQAEGYKSVEVAKENGSWTRLDGVENLEVPEDLKQELKSHKGALVYFNSLSDSSKKGLLYWVHSAKREQTRQKRILEIIENAGNQLKPKQFR